MIALPSLPIVVPLLGAALLGGAGKHLPRRVGEAIALAVAIAVVACDAVLLARSVDAPIVYWLGGWWPRAGVCLGIDLAIDPFGAGFALLAAALAVAAIVFALGYVESAHAQLHALLLAFLAALEGFGLTGDLFDLFVFFELMGACAFALCGFKSRDEAPIQGAINFAVVNTIGAFLVLWGIALVYARTGALNLAQIGRGLHGARDALVVVAFTLIAAGFFAKAALVPFHFWLADAHAVAPTPVCVLFSGVMVEAGLYAVARVHGAAFAPSFVACEAGVQRVLLALGALTAIVGGVMAFAQRHVKRLLAYSTVSHAGAMAIGVACFRAKALGGAGLYALAHGGVKGSLFLCAGILLHRFRSIDEIALRGRGRRLPAIGALVAIGGFALAGGAPFGLWAATRAIDEALEEAHASWASHAATIGAVLTGAAVLRVALRVFVGRGAEGAETPGIGGEHSERPETPRDGRVPLTMAIPAFALLAAGLAIGLAPRWGALAGIAAARVLDTAGYAHAVLDGARAFPAIDAHAATGGVAKGLAMGGAAIAIALVTIFRERVPDAIRAPIGGAWRAGVLALRRAHTGRVGDYVAWLAFGVAAMGGALAIATRG